MCSSRWCQCSGHESCINETSDVEVEEWRDPDPSDNVESQDPPGERERNESGIDQDDDGRGETGEIPDRNTEHVEEIPRTEVHDIICSQHVGFLCTFDQPAYVVHHVQGSVTSDKVDQLEDGSCLWDERLNDHDDDVSVNEIVRVVDGRLDVFLRFAIGGAHLIFYLLNYNLS